jgi:chromosome condensin MukBEF complex kleisin-like MukF subunit
VIVRVMGEGQYEVADELGGRLNELDEQALAALEREDEAGLDATLEQMAALVRQEGTPLAADDLRVSDVVIPPTDLTLEETRQLVSEHGLIPDLPA